MELDQNYQKKPLVLQDKHRLKINRQKFMMSFVIAEQKIRCKLLQCCNIQFKRVRTCGGLKVVKSNVGRWTDVDWVWVGSI